MPTILDTTGNVFTLINASETPSLSFPNLTALSGPMDVEGNPLLTAITFGSAVVFANTTLTFKSNALTTATLDGILARVNANGTSNGTLDLSGNGGDVSATGWTDFLGLMSRNWQVIINGFTLNGPTVNWRITIDDGGGITADPTAAVGVSGVVLTDPALANWILQVSDAGNLLLTPTGAAGVPAVNCLLTAGLFKWNIAVDINGDLTTTQV